MLEWFVGLDQNNQVIVATAMIWLSAAIVLVAVLLLIVAITVHWRR